MIFETVSSPLAKQASIVMTSVVSLSSCGESPTRLAASRFVCHCRSVITNGDVTTPSPREPYHLFNTNFYLRSYHSDHTSPLKQLSLLSRHGLGRY